MSELNSPEVPKGPTVPSLNSFYGQLEHSLTGKYIKGINEDPDDAWGDAITYAATNLAVSLKEAERPQSAKDEVRQLWRNDADEWMTVFRDIALGQRTSLKTAIQGKARGFYSGISVLGRLSTANLTQQEYQQKADALANLAGSLNT